MYPDRTLAALGNDYNPDILRTAYKPHSAQEFSDLLDIPIATCYRRIEELSDAGLLTLHDRVLSDEHRRTNVYRREIDEINVQFSDDELVEADVLSRFDEELRMTVPDRLRMVGAHEAAHVGAISDTVEQLGGTPVE
jgi:hypothetical protein